MKDSRFKIQVLRWLALALVASWPVGVSAQSVLLKGATVHTVSGRTLSPGDVLVENGKITAVAPTVNSAGAKVIDLKGLHLYPGLIALDSSQGLIEIESVRATLDTTETGDFKPDVQAWIAVNPDSELIPVARANGVTHIEPAPQGGIVAGVSGLMQLDGWTTEQMAIKRPTGLHIYWPAMGLNTTPREQFRDKSRFKSLPDQAKERAAKLKALDDFFQEAKAYAKGRASQTPPGVNPPWEGMLPALKGEIPIVIHAEELRQIKAAVQWAKTNEYKMILAGGTDAWRVADLLAAEKIPVIYEITFEQPYRDHYSYDVNFKAPEILRKAGVKVAFSMGPTADRTPLVKNLPYDVAQCVAYGYPEDEAIKGMTLYPAQLMGVADRLGSIEVGKEASFVACDAGILDIRANVKYVWIAGKEMSLANRHTRLYEKYKSRPLPPK